MFLTLKMPRKWLFGPKRWGESALCHHKRWLMVIYYHPFAATLGVYSIRKGSKTEEFTLSGGSKAYPYRLGSQMAVSTAFCLV